MSCDVLFVIPTYNRAADLPRTLRAIAGQDWPESSIAILVVDNSSTDNTEAVVASMMQELSCKLEYLRKLPEGPTVARNVGLRRATARYVAMVDSDVELHHGWTAATVAAMEAESSLAMVGGKVVFASAPHLINAYGGEIGFLGLVWDLDEGVPAAERSRRRDVLWFNSSAMLLRTEVAQSIGGFDEAFYIALEEADLGIRLAIAGWSGCVVPDAVALHHLPSAVLEMGDDLVFHLCKNRIRMGIKVWSMPRLCEFLVVNLAFALADAILHRPRAARFRALWWNVTHLPDTWRARRKVQASRRVPDSTVAKRLAPSWFPPTRLRGLRRRVVDGVLEDARGPARAGGIR